MIAYCFIDSFPILPVGESYILREQSDQDTDAFFNYYSDPEVGRYILASKPQTRLEALLEIQHGQNLFPNKQGFFWALAEKQTNRMIGAIGLYLNLTHHRAEICYDLARSHWRQGIMTEAMQSVMDYCFQELKLARLEAITIATNQASIGLLNKLGFTHEGTLKKSRYFNGDYHDVELYAALA
jgi:ribosomal-protein-alanine N-acetyltransferase